MRGPSRFTVRQKLMVILMATSGIAVVAASVAISTYSSRQMHASLRPDHRVKSRTYAAAIAM